MSVMSYVLAAFFATWPYRFHQFEPNQSDERQKPVRGKNRRNRRLQAT